MRRELSGVLNAELKPLLSELAYAVLNDSAFEVWKDKVGLYSVSVGWNAHVWVLFDAPLEKLDHFLCCQIPFYCYDEGKEVDLYETTVQ